MRATSWLAYTDCRAMENDDGSPPDPYAAPREVARKPDRFSHGYLKWIYLALLLLPFATALVSRNVIHPSRTLAIALGMFAIVDLLAMPIVSLAWLYKTWGLVAKRERGATTAAFAIGALFIPIYNLWWLYASSSRIAATLERRLGRLTTRVTAPTFLSWCAPTCTMLSVFVVAVATFAASGPAAASSVTMALPCTLLPPFVWFAWMWRVDSGFKEIFAHRTH
jgi:hypothetical protein